MKEQLLGRSVAISRDGNVDVTRRTRLGASRYSEPANQRTGHSSVVKLHKNAVQRTLDGEIAGARIHGTTRKVPREVYQAEEKPQDAARSERGL
jgi:hypothetical protein